MKKFIAIIAILFSVMVCNAQITIVSQNESKTEKVCTLRAMYADLYHNSEVGYYITANSSNEFDDPYIITLGKEKEDAIETMNTLINVGENKLDITAQNGTSKLRMWGDSFLGIKALFVKNEHYAGNFSLNVNELKRGLDKLKSHTN
jgi:hypothetical protein